MGRLGRVGLQPNDMSALARASWFTSTSRSWGGSSAAPERASSAWPTGEAVPAAKTRIDYATLGSDAGFIGAAGCARMAHTGRS